MAIVTDSSQRTDLGPRIDPDLLAYQLAVRGKNWGDLAKSANGISPTTATRLRAGVRAGELNRSTLVKLARWLAETPVDRHLEAVIARPEQTSESGS